MLRGCTPPKEEYKQQKGQNNLQNKITPPENLLPPNKTKTNKQTKNKLMIPQIGAVKQEENSPYGSNCLSVLSLQLIKRACPY